MPTEAQPLAPKAIEVLSGISTATLTTVLLKKGLRNVWMRGTKPLRPGQQGRLVGRAFTLRFVPAREDLATPESWSSPISTRAAIEAMPEGCIAVVDAMGCTDAGIFGDILCARMAKKGVAALITDGVVRDLAGVLGTGLPVWCSGAAAPPSVAGLTFVNWQEPIGCGGVAVFPNDVVVVDDDGAVLIPQALLDAGGRERRRAGGAGGLDHGRGGEGRVPARPLSPERREQGALRGEPREGAEPAARRRAPRPREKGAGAEPNRRGDEETMAITRRSLAALGASVLAAPRPALAADWPAERPIR